MNPADPLPSRRDSRSAADPMAAMAAMLGGVTSVGLRTQAECADDLQCAAGLLETRPEPAARRVAAGLRQWLRDGGDIGKHLGVKLRRGGAYERPETSKRYSARNSEIRSLAERFDGGVTAKAEAVVKMLNAGHPDTLVIREQVDAPTSLRQVVRILRGEGA